MSNKEQSHIELQLEFLIDGLSRRCQGGISNEVMNCKYMRDNISSGAVGGYVGAIENRTDKIDRKIEKRLRSLGMTIEEIAHWFSSRASYHWTDNPIRKRDILSLDEDTVKWVRDWIKEERGE